MTMVECINAEDLYVGRSCPRTRCGGYLERSPFVEGLLCSVCKTEYRGK